MTTGRTYKSLTKSVQKRSSSLDLRSPKKYMPLTPSSSQISTSSCLDELFSDLNLSRSSNKRFWGQIYSRTQRCFHLSSLADQQALSSSPTDVSSLSSGSNKKSIKRCRKPLAPLILNQTSSVSSSTPSYASKNTTSNKTTSFPFMTKIEKDTSNWGFFVEAEEESDFNFVH